nr:HNH endonuclease [Alteribacter salitolerans]
MDEFDFELKNTDTQYFILDTKGTLQDHGDVDFKSYDWSPSRYNLVNEGDLFIYRRPQSFSEVKGEFYFFGAGKIGTIRRVGKDRLSGEVIKPVPFTPVLLKSELSHFKWTFKPRGETWERFFNQYGMNKIAKEDFLGLAGLANRETNIEDSGFAEQVIAIQKQQQKSYYVGDSLGVSKTRGNYQVVFSDQVKRNYGYRCAITGIKTRGFLVGSHIIPWSINKETRLDPRNGICLSTFVDQAFDKGFITITSDYRVKLSPKVYEDGALFKELTPYNGVRIKVPRHGTPKREYLEWHNNNIFLH